MSPYYGDNLTGVPSIQQHDKKYFVGTLRKIGLYLMYVCLCVDLVSLIKVLAILLPFYSTPTDTPIRPSETYEDPSQ